ncbi:MULTISPECIES: L-fuculose-phosphate aldolase [Bacillus cereus group]|uniref:Fuculose phosphate aldolase n=1 Tax=Bacillus thuringiensis serovar mexicanensis TaxID=180868 RepID=A0A242WCR8_BACTU|nr:MULTISPECIES: L-fuculose-phosphate aldolase [Bacillus cereus group]EEM55782.1 Class II aldolase/adducin [Bacillus thuringiensis serovar monterrey BGSC 4AJ1]MEB9674193.1 L-fuculose-phosphate aldolase [Bacillus anthracis]OTW52806.1 fuculose phosphate aldolase [Bacillus thuringiensis serovar mexicanensis]OTX08743.1 fuculose phosphate aldolase [Bacillus thuringiensis serovar monterrey]
MFSPKQREQIIEVGRKLVDNGLTSGTGGNISIYDSETKEVLITPSGFDFYEMDPDDLVTIDLEGNVLSHNNKHKPSSEWQMHCILYKEREDIISVVHAHTVYATVLSCLHEPLRPTHYMIAVAGVDVRVAEYATFGTKELAENAWKAMKDRKAVLLANHGMLAGDLSLNNAFNIIEEVEYCSKIYCIAKSIGNPVILDHKEMKVMAKKFETYSKRK